MLNMFCGVEGCDSGNRGSPKLFALPFADLGGNRRVKEVTLKQRETWLNRLGMTDKGQKNLYVCSEHFIGGKPSPLFDVTSSSWAPALNLPESSFLLTASHDADKSDDDMILHRKTRGQTEIKSELNDEDCESELVIEDPSVLVEPFLEDADALMISENDDFEDEEEVDQPPLMIVPEVSLDTDEKNTFFSQEVEITEECVELMKDSMKIPSFDYSCSLCEFSTSHVSGNIYYIRSREGNIYFPCEMCQFVKITLQTATQTFMSKVTKRVNRDGSETLTIPSYKSEEQNRIDRINKSRKATADGISKRLSSSRQSTPGSVKEAGSYPGSSVSSPIVDLTTNVKGVQEKKYACDYCPYNTTTFYRLQQHVQKDHNIERHICPQVKCSFEAEDEASLKEHVMNVHEGSRFPCHLCSFLATRKATLKTHIESIHEGVKYPCEQCGYAATQMSALRRHVRSQHGIPEFKK